MHIWQICCGIIPRLIFSFALDYAILSLTLKERAIHAYLARRLLWQYPLIDIFFRFKRVILSLTLKERGLHVSWSGLFVVAVPLNWCTIFRFNASYCRSRLKNDVYMYIWLVCCGSISGLIYSFVLNAWWDAFYGPYTDLKLRLRSVQNHIVTLIVQWVGR